MRDVAGTLVLQAIVAENGVREIVRTSSISGGGPAGSGRGRRVVAVGVARRAGRGLEGHARQGEEPQVAGVRRVERDVGRTRRRGTGPLTEAVLPVAPDARRSPGRELPLVPLVSRPTGVTGRPLGGAKVNGACATFGVAGRGRDRRAESEPGRPILKPIVRTADDGKQEPTGRCRRGTL